jgi:WD40 repeat protein
MTLSLDGQQLARGLESGDLYVSGTKRADLVAEKCLHCDAAVQAVAFSPDGRTLAAAGGNFGLSSFVSVYDTYTGRRGTRFGGFSREVNSVAFSPDGRLLAAAVGDGTVVLWPAARDDELPAPDHTNRVR